MTKSRGWLSLMLSSMYFLRSSVFFFFAGFTNALLIIFFFLYFRVLRLQAGHKYCLLGRLSSEVGWNHYDTIKVCIAL